MKNFVADLYWNFINVGKGKFYVEDPRIPFVNGFSLILLLVLYGFGAQRLFFEGSEALVPAVINFFVAILLTINLVVLRRTLNAQRAGSFLSAIVVVLIVYVFWEGGTGGDSGFLWVFPIPTLIFFLSGKKAALKWSIVLVLLLVSIIILKTYGILELSYSATQLNVFLFPLATIIVGLYIYAKFTELNTQELEQRTRSIKEGFEAEKRVISAESRAKEEALREKLDTFFNTTTDLVGIANLKGEFLEVNPAFLNEFQYTKEEMLGQLFRNFLSPDDIEKSIKAKESLAKGTPLTNFLTQNVRKDGTKFWLMWNAVAKGGYIYATARNVDDIINAEQKVKERMKEIEDLNRLMVGREVRMAELKEEVEALRQATGKTETKTQL